MPRGRLERCSHGQPLDLQGEQGTWPLAWRGEAGIFKTGGGSMLQSFSDTCLCFWMSEPYLFSVSPADF